MAVRRGDSNAIGLLITIAIGLLIIVVTVPTLRNSFLDLKNVNTCEYHGQGVCQESCVPSVEYQDGVKECAAKGGVCCKRLDGMPEDKTKAGTTPGGGTQPDRIPNLMRPTITTVNQINSPVTSGQLVTVLYGIDSDPKLTTSIQLQAITKTGVTAKTDVNTANDCSKQAPTNPYIVCEFSSWKTEIVLQTLSGQAVNTFTFSQVDAKEAVLTKDEKTTQYIDTITPVLTGPAPVDKNKKTYLQAETVKYDIKFNEKFAKDFLGQTMQLSTSVYPKDNPTSPLAKQQKIQFKVLPPVRYQGLNELWSREKSVTAFCDQNYKVYCDDILFKIKNSVSDATASPAPPCDDAVPDQKIAINKLSETSTMWYMIDKDYNHLQQFNTANMCWDAVASMQDSSFTGIITPLLQTANTAGTFTDPQGQALLALISRNGGVTCIGQTDQRTTGDVSYDTFYRAESFNIQLQNGVIRLAQGTMAGKYLCVYGWNKATSKLYSAGKAQKIYIDRTPPIADIKFSPLTNRITFLCQDGDGTEDGKTESGCSDMFGVAYISDVTKFLPALVSSPQSAATWCPTGGYVTETRHSLIYTPGEIRVLCMQARDKAGNTGVTMQIVFNGYDLLAKSLILYMKK
jgi:hypothetical protein